MSQCYFSICRSDKNPSAKSSKFQEYSNISEYIAIFLKKVHLLVKPTILIYTLLMNTVVPICGMISRGNEVCRKIYDFLMKLIRICSLKFPLVVI